MTEPAKNSTAGKRCPQCGAELPANLPPDLCPRCLLKTGLATQPQTGPGGTVVIPAEPLSRGLPQPGEQLGHYRIVRSLGGGGMGAVFEAEDLENGRRVALKVLSQALDSPDARQRFFREGRLAASINHPNSVYVFGTEELGGIPLIAMELVAGGTLEDRVRSRGPMPPAEAVDAVLQIIAGLEAAQRIGILHRDVKPSNCFVDTDGTIKIGDFGLSISTTLRIEPALTAAGSFLGTPAFSSPEQLRGEELNVRSDIYAVGATLFYLLTGRTPFEAKNVVALIATVLEEPAPSPRLVQPSLPRGLSRVVRRCLEKQPTERFKSYEELRKALAPYSSTAPVPATLGLRFGAGLVDMFFLGLVGWIIAVLLSFHPFGLLHGSHDSTPGQETTFDPFDFLDLLSRASWQALAIIWVALIGMVIYYAVLEGRWGFTLGKLVFGLRVVGPDNNPPGFLRALPRPLLYVLVPCLPYWLVYGINPKAYLGASTAFQTLVGSFFYILVAVLFSTARRRNGFAALHDLLTKTRVVSRATLHARPAPVVGEASPAAVETKPLIGPYHVLDTLEDSAGTAWLLGYDLRLLRKVWIRTVPAGTPPVPAPLRNLGRVGRLRWLTGRRSPEENWDAFEAVSGQPLPRLIEPGPQKIPAPGQHPGQDAVPASNAQPWAQVRYWLCDLATEMSAAQKDGTFPPLLALDRVWVTGDGRAKLLDFPAPGLSNLPRSPHLTDLAIQSSNSASPPSPVAIPHFLGQMAAATLEGRADAAAKSPSEVSVPLPLHVRQFFQVLPNLLDADALLRSLRPLLQRVAVVTRARRAAMVAACAAFPLLTAGSCFLGLGLLEQWNRRHPGVLELSQLLQERSALRRWAKNQSGPTDRQWAVYIAGHYDATITNRDTWSSAMALSLIKGEDRRFAEQSLVLNPPPAANEITEVDAALKTYRFGFNEFDWLRQPSFVLMMLNATLAIYVCLPALAAALAFRGGLVLLVTGVTFVRRDGAPARRPRLFWRTFVAWSPLLPALVLTGISVATKSAGSGTLAVGLLLGLALVSVALPQRGLQDRLAGTWPVPR
ncbi:MAG TPA: protein kinase [Candidatus Binatia bacterium]|jgi:hypothetical protein|nr:protein kinase [Candidatus Binatia bacterium]